jgi:hypothetical protein
MLTDTNYDEGHSPPYHCANDITNTDRGQRGGKLSWQHATWLKIAVLFLCYCYACHI